MRIRPHKKLALIALLFGLGTVLVVTRSSWAPPVLARFLFPCQDEVKQEMRSENGRYIAKVVERNCGATTRFGTRLDLRSSGPRLFAKNQEVFTQENQCPIRLIWAGDTLHVEYQKSCGKVFQQIDSWLDVYLKFKTNAPS